MLLFLKYLSFCSNFIHLFKTRMKNWTNILKSYSPPQAKSEIGIFSIQESILICMGMKVCAGDEYWKILKARKFKVNKNN